ncbi:MAG: hypothetical protein ACD_23C00964G0004 [uncultured bacterium]|nr:MAG: hypothetical protein ACD_23C00964G0004 [uncultured bacterium]
MPNDCSLASSEVKLSPAVMLASISKTTLTTALVTSAISVLTDGTMKSSMLNPSNQTEA